MAQRQKILAVAATDSRVEAPAPPRIIADAEGGHRFFRAPRSIQAVVAAFIEPALNVGMFYAAHCVTGARFDRMAIWLSLLVIALTFPGTDRFRDKPLDALLGIVGNWATTLVLLAMCGYVTASYRDFDLETLQLWAIATPLAHWVTVLMGRSLLRRRARSDDTLRRAVVVGGGASGILAAKALSATKDARIEVVGYFDDRIGDRLHALTLGKRLGRLDEVARYVDKLCIREVYITLPMSSQARMVKLLEDLQRTTTSIFFVPDVFSMSVVQGRLQDVDGLPVVGICETPFTGVNALIKRLCDIVVSTAILVAAAPLLALIAIGVKLSSPGPVLFKQRRNGLDGEEIIVWKFRTMNVVEDGKIIRQVTRDDPRITPIGRWLRRTSLDELPQFFNVLQGRMSIVGPRPHAVAHNEQYRQLIKAYMVRHKARPGVTGWAQINGFRGETESLEKMEGRIECDLEYLRNWSVGLDFNIMLRTLRLIVSDQRAY